MVDPAITIMAKIKDINMEVKGINMVDKDINITEVMDMTMGAKNMVIVTEVMIITIAFNVTLLQTFHRVWGFSL